MLDPVSYTHLDVDKRQTENYMFTRLYLSGAQLESLLGGTPEWNTDVSYTHLSGHRQDHAG